MHNPIYHLHMGNVAILNKLLHVLAVISRFKTTPSAGESQICRQTLVWVAISSHIALPNTQAFLSMQQRAYRDTHPPPQPEYTTRKRKSFGQDIRKLWSQTPLFCCLYEKEGFLAIHLHLLSVQMYARRANLTLIIDRPKKRGMH